jgi:hypothetical protein
MRDSVRGRRKFDLAGVGLMKFQAESVAGEVDWPAETLRMTGADLGGKEFFGGEEEDAGEVQLRVDCLE